MTDDVLPRVAAVARTVFRDPHVHITRSTTADDVSGWDSLAHVAFIAAVELEFGLRFSIAEVAGLDTIGDLVDLIESRIGKRE